MAPPGNGLRTSEKAMARRSPSRFWRRFRADRIGIASCLVVLAVLLTAFFAPWLAPHDPLAIDTVNRLVAPGAQHLMGTDEMGRDLLSRVLHGARISLQLAGMVVVLAVSLGMVLGTAAGYAGGRADQLLMRITDVFLAFPDLILAMALSAALGPSIENAALALGLVWWPGYARLVRGQVLATKHREYVESARAIGAGHLRIVLKHLLPNCLDPVYARVTMTAGYAVLAGASLSFIGLGAQPPAPEWGLMIAFARKYVLTAWWYPTIVGTFIVVVVLAFTMAGDAIQDALNVQIRD